MFPLTTKSSTLKNEREQPKCVPFLKDLALKGGSTTSGNTFSILVGIESKIHVYLADLTSLNNSKFPI